MPVFPVLHFYHIGETLHDDTPKVLDDVLIVDPAERSPNHGLTGRRILELERRMLAVKAVAGPDSKAWEQVARDAAWRCAALLAANDIRGALDECEAWAFAQQQAEGERQWEWRRANPDIERAKELTAKANAIRLTQRAARRPVARRADDVQQKRA